MKKLTLFLIALMGVTVITTAQNALEFDGSTGRAYVGGDVTAFNINTGTVEFWVNPSATGTYKLVGKTTNNAATNGYAIGLTGGVPVCELFPSAGGATISLSLSSIPNNEWTHIAFSWISGGNINGYINGILDGTTANSTTFTFTNTNFLMIATAPWNLVPSFYYNGKMDELKIWNDVRTQTEIEDNMMIGLPSNEDNLVAYYAMNDGIGSTLTDNTTAGSYNGAIDGGYSWVRGAFPIYVDADATGSNDGSTWANAYQSFQDALDAAADGNQIWVAAGTYYPSNDYGLDIAYPNTQRGYHFMMINGVSIYGGFAGDETAISQRSDYGDGQANETILSGDNTCYHVFYHPDGTNLDNTAILDGFTVTKGNASTASPHNAGGGIYNYNNSPTITNCLFMGNSSSLGSGIYNEISSATITNCLFMGNSSDHGSGIYNLTSPTTITNCTFYNNTASAGGGMYNNDNGSSLTITNCTFTNNNANGGGGICNNESSPTVKNTILWGNTAFSGSQIYNLESSTPSISYSNIDQDGYTGNNNIRLNPLFAGAQNPSHPYSLTGVSSCADVGDNTANSQTYDIRGADFGRKLDKDDGLAGTIDMGAYEYKFDTDPLVPGYFVDADATSGTNSGADWANAFTSFQSGLDAATTAGAGSVIWVAAGTYYPSYDYGLNIASPNTARGYHFQMINGVEIYGGFAGTETAVSQRTDFGSGEANETILSGDIGVDDDDNCYHVFFHLILSTLDNSAVIDGFTISDANANGTTPHDRGGGMYNYEDSPTINNIIFSNNQVISTGNGGAINNAENSNPKISNSLFINNTAGYGAGIANSSSAIILTNCAFISNSASGNGGAILSSASAHTIINCTFSSNTATAKGGALYNTIDSDLIVTNSIFWNNTSPLGNEIYNSDSYPTLTNCDIEGGLATISENSGSTTTDGGGNIDQSPLFAGTQNPSHPYSLTGASPCTDVGDNSVNSQTYDIRGTDFYRNLNKDNGTTVVADKIDIGAYEYKHDTDPVGAILYVKYNASGSDNGMDWTNAYTSLQSAFDASASGVEIWVAAGIYKPSTMVDGSTDRDKAFQMVNGVKIYGGFAGTETTLAERDITANVTILSGDIDDSGDNDCYHVFYHPETYGDIDNTSKLDGFTIRDSKGAIMGGGLYDFNTNSDTRTYIIENCTFTNNSSTSRGGGLALEQATLEIINCIFYDNSSVGGGAMYINYNSSTIINCLFYDNVSTGYAGAVYNNGNPHTPTFTNCTFLGNEATNGGGAVFNANSVTPAFKNTVLWGNTCPVNAARNEIYNSNSTPTFSYCDIENSFDGGSWNTTLGTNITGNIDSNPLFAVAQNPSHPYSLTGASPCADVGLSSANSETYDIRGADFGRDLDKTTGAVSTDKIDMGAYEYKHGTDPVGVTFYVKDNAIGNDNGMDWDNAFTSFQSALDASASGCEIWVAAGIYKPSQEPDGTTDSPRDFTFQMINGVKIYGGFDGDETTLSERDITANETILSGDIDGGDDDCYNVFYHPNTYGDIDNTSKLDGFTIKDGKGASNGGGFHDNNTNIDTREYTIENCTFTSNLCTDNGGGLYFRSVAAEIINCTFSNCNSTRGGGIYLYSSGTSFINCTFTNNSASQSGGAIYVGSNSPAPTFTNCLLFNNNTYNNGIGGGICISYGSATFNNVTIVNNYSKYGGGIYATQSIATINNCIIWGNTGNNGNILNENATINAYYSDIDEDGYTGNNNIRLNPLFADIGNDDYRLTSLSPCVNVGNNAANTETYDIRGEARIHETTIDMGAYEYTSGTDPEAAEISWDAGASTTDWGTDGNWDADVVPTAGYNITIPTSSHNPIISATQTADCNNLTVASGATLTLESTVDGTGSLIVNGAASGDVVMERYIGAATWETWNDGWHFLSSPVADYPIQDNFTVATAADYDFYAWSEPHNLWINFKTGNDPLFITVNGSNDFELGHGYMAAYKTTDTKDFTGAINVSDIEIDGLTVTDDGTNRSWHLLGNPFSSGLTWDEFWSKSDIGGTINIWNEDGQSYTSITAAATGIIPATNGFMVQAESDGAMVTIPASKRTHGGTFYKGADFPIIKLKANNIDSPSFQESQLLFIPESTTGYESEYDGDFLPGYAPLFYSKIDNMPMSVNSMPNLEEVTTIPFTFIKNEGLNFSIEMYESENMGMNVWLLDKKLNKDHNLTQNPVYFFTAFENDNLERFNIHFSPLGVDEPTTATQLIQVWAANNTINIFNEHYLSGDVKVLNMFGQVIVKTKLNGDSNQQVMVTSPSGYYIVNIITNKGVVNKKVYLR